MRDGVNTKKMASMVWYGMVEVCEGAPVAVGMPLQPYLFYLSEGVGQLTYLGISQ